MKYYVLEFSHFCFIVGQGQPKAIIWIILVVLQYQMQHIKFQSNLSTGFREEDF